YPKVAKAKQCMYRYIFVSCIISTFINRSGIVVLRKLNTYNLTVIEYISIGHSCIREVDTTDMLYLDSAFSFRY
ncbi:hypothetical protein L9F63_002695, partial [Diploptera punctata]